MAPFKLYSALILFVVLPYVLLNFPFGTDAIVLLGRMDAPCICPGIYKPVCTKGQAGIIHRHDNLCMAKCSVKPGYWEEIFPGALCIEIMKMNTSYISQENNSFYESTWFKEMEKEINFYDKNVHSYMSCLLRALGVPLPPKTINTYPIKNQKVIMEMPCICPAIHRPISLMSGLSRFGQRKYTNLCGAICSSDDRNLLVIFPWSLYEKKDSTVTFAEDVLHNFDFYLNRWKEDMEKEIQFYEKIFNIMGRLNAF